MRWTAKTDLSTFGQSATLKTSDPAAGEISLVISGKVVDTVAAEPRSWNLGDLAASEPIHLETTLFNYSSKPLEIVSVHWMDKPFEALSKTSIERRDIDPGKDSQLEASEAFDLTADIAPGTPQGPLHQVLRIEYRNAGETEIHPPLELVLTGKLVGAISVVGGAQLHVGVDGGYRLDLGVADPGEAKQEKVHVLLRGHAEDGVKLRVGEVEPAESLEAELGEPTQRGETRIYPLVVKIKPDSPKVVRDGTHDGQTGMVMIESGHPEVAPVRIRVVFRVGQPFGKE